MKIAAFIGSANKNGNTAKTVKQFYWRRKQGATSRSFTYAISH